MISLDSRDKQDSLRMNKCSRESSDLTLNSHGSCLTLLSFDVLKCVMESAAAQLQEVKNPKIKESSKGLKDGRESEGSEREGNCFKHNKR